MRILLLILLLIPNLSWAVSSGWYSTLQGNNSDVQSGSIPDGSTLQYSTSAGQWQFSYATVPAGGSTGYVLTKNSGSNYDYSWKPSSGGSGTIGGSIASGKVAYGSGTNTIQGSSNFLYTTAINTLSLNGTFETNLIDSLSSDLYINSGTGYNTLVGGPLQVNLDYTTSTQEFSVLNSGPVAIFNVDTVNNIVGVEGQYYQTDGTGSNLGATVDIETSSPEIALISTDPTQRTFQQFCNENSDCGSYALFGKDGSPCTLTSGCEDYATELASYGTSYPFIFVADGAPFLRADNSGDMKFGDYDAYYNGFYLETDQSSWYWYGNSTQIMNLDSGGDLSVAGNYEINGSQIAAANLADGTTGAGGNVVLSLSPTITSPIIVGETINNTSGVTKNCATSGTVTWYPVEGGSAYKVVIGYANACLGASASFSFPHAFSHTPAVLTTNELGSALLSTLSTSAVVMTGTTSTGYIFIEGN